MERDLTRILADLGFRATQESAMDFKNQDDSRVIQIVASDARLRELRSRIAELGLYLSKHERVREACLLLRSDRLRRDRLQREWDDVLGILRPDIANRLALVAVGEKFAFSVPPTPELTRLAREAQPVFLRAAARTSSRLKYFDVFHVLLVRWLLNEGPISRHELGEKAGCTYPTIAKAIQRLGRVVEHGSNRSVALRAFPRREWQELVALSPTLRSPIAYVDGSGRPPDLEGLRRRLQKLKLWHVAVGGVVAAHHWDPDFDLQGLPRLDISVHAQMSLDLSFIERLDPALQPVKGDATQPPTLVVHAIRRPYPLFAPAKDAGLPVTDPVETLLDLHELGLEGQAQELVERLRKGAA
jgi:hypothetical protein